MIPGLLKIISTNDDKANIVVIKCEICKKIERKYTCPKCNLRYCSTECYQHKSHLTCVEAFSKESIKSFLLNEKKPKNDIVENIRVKSILSEHEKRVTQDINESYVDEDFVERFQNINLETSTVEDLWKLLKSSEKIKFLNMVDAKSGRSELSREIQCWKPWWLEFREDLVGNLGIEDLDENSEQKNFHIPTDLPMIREDRIIGKKNIDERLILSIFDSIFSYIFLCRLFNGNREWPQDAIDILLSNVPSLTNGSKFMYKSTSDFSNLVMQRYLKATTFDVNNYVHLVTVVKDMIFILECGWTCVLYCLADLHVILSSTEFQSYRYLPEKVYFYMAYCKSIAKNFEKKDVIVFIVKEFLAMKESLENHLQCMK